MTRQPPELGATLKPESLIPSDELFPFKQFEVPDEFSKYIDIPGLGKLTVGFSSSNPENPEEESNPNVRYIYIRIDLDPNLPEAERKRFLENHRLKITKSGQEHFGALPESNPDDTQYTFRRFSQKEGPEMRPPRAMPVEKAEIHKTKIDLLKV
ncbi:MAG: hypothetical protein Q7S45_02445 [Candidatus Curtissbacteria bacterium]|nr:hypothetical protein [Candidatus Curtissbacteria bacterium]